jgi:acyl transferase domain-containing protein
MKTETQEIEPTTTSGLDVAIVGTAGRFPGARDLTEFWENLKHGVESIQFFPAKEVVDSGIHPEMAGDRDFVPAAGGMEDEYTFDAEFFEFSPRDAQILDPQQRVFLECAWEALESAGYDPETYRGRVGVFAGASINTYMIFHIIPNRRLFESIGHFQTMTASDKDFLATRVAYKLNLKGPAVSVQTACSTSLVAVNLACQSLLNYQADMVLAGGVSITPKGRLYKEGFIFSRDGHCRAFDEAAQGTVGGNGVGIVVLKRLEDALADGDHIHAVIKGSAVNNDGSLKVGYTAPSVSGQVEVILEALGASGIDPATITYVEAHGTGTLLGDPIEIAALTQAYRTRTDKKGYCAIGSVKTNVGHLDAAAGISGLIKAVLAIEKSQIPPSLHFRRANPKLGLEGSPFFVNAALADWRTPDGLPRRAAVSSFGFGGTNAHAILEEAPPRAATGSGRGWELLPLSARTDAALEQAVKNLGAFLRQADGPSLPDVSYTLQVGRKHFAKRAFAVVRDGEEAAGVLEERDARRLAFGAIGDGSASGVAFMFSGQGSQHVGMARELYLNEPVFAEALRECAALMRPHLEADLLSVLHPEPGGEAEAEERLSQTRYTQPALFAVEYSLARLWEAWGVKPAGMIGHSVGEYVAACLAGVFDLATAARLVCRRGALIQGQPAGAMLSVPLSAEEIAPYLSREISLAVVNAPRLVVAAGSHEAIARLQDALASRGTEGRLLRVSHAFHSHLMDEAARGLADELAGVRLSPPRLRYVSNVTGRWITDEEATDPAYWARHLRNTVRFHEGLQTLLDSKPAALLEVGPGQTLVALARQQRGHLDGCLVVASTPHAQAQGSDTAQALQAAGQLWSRGVSLDWRGLRAGESRRRVPLPTYPFQRKLYWLPPLHQTPGVESEAALLSTEAPDPAPALLSEERASYQPPRSEEETAIARIWESMLGIPRIGVNEDFFKLGGHSLLGTQLVAEVRRVTHTDLSVQVLFAEPTVAGLARRVRELKADNPDFQARTIQPIPRDGRLPLTFHQEWVWRYESAFPGTCRFNGFITMRLRGRLDMAAVHHAVDEIVRRHEVLRTTYRWTEDGQAAAVVAPPFHVELPVVDLSAWPPAEREEEALRLANQLVRTPFDLTRDVFIRPTLVKCAGDEHLMLISSHYVAVDGWTIGLVIQEFGEHYSAHVAKRASRAPALAFQCVDYAHHQREQVTPATIDAHLPYWREQLLDIPDQNPIPLDRPRPELPGLAGSNYHFTLGPKLTQAVKDFSHQHGSTTFMTFVAGLNALFHACSGSPDICIGTMTGDREIGLESLVGAFVNCLALRTRIQPEDSFLDVLGRVRGVATAAYAHQIPFSLLLERLSAERDLLKNPLFRTFFILRNVPVTETQAEDLHVQLAALPIDRGTSDQDTTLYLQEKAGAFSGYFEYSTDLFERETIAALARDFVGLLEQVVANPERRLSELAVSLQRLAPQEG